MTELNFFQHILKSYHKKSTGSSEFILSDANHNAFLYISNWPNWYGNSCFLHGKNGSGKTHLSKIWQQNSDAYPIELFKLNKKLLNIILEKYSNFIIDDINQYFTRKYLLKNLDKHDFSNFEETILNILDHCKSNKKFILITADSEIEKLNIKTKDLKSRIKLASPFKLESPNQSSIKTFLIERFSNYQLKISNDILDFLSKNLPTSFTEAEKIAKKIDEVTLKQKRKPSLNLVKELINEEKLSTT